MPIYCHLSVRSDAKERAFMSSYFSIFLRSLLGGLCIEERSAGASIKPIICLFRTSVIFNLIY